MDHGHMDLGQQTRTLFDPRSRLHIIGTESVHFHYFCTLYWLSVISHCLIALLFFLLLYLPVPVTKATHRPCVAPSVSIHEQEETRGGIVRGTPGSGSIRPGGSGSPTPIVAFLFFGGGTTAVGGSGGS